MPDFNSEEKILSKISKILHLIKKLTKNCQIITEWI